METSYIIKNYNKYSVWDRTHTRYTFKINGNEYAIMEVELEWGLPQLSYTIEEEDAPETYHLYNTYEEAIQYVQQLKTLNY